MRQVVARGGDFLSPHYYALEVVEEGTFKHDHRFVHHVVALVHLCILDAVQHELTHDGSRILRRQALWVLDVLQHDLTLNVLCILLHQAQGHVEVGGHCRNHLVLQLFSVLDVSCILLHLELELVVV